MPRDPYVYPGTEVLRNRFGVRDADELARREANVTGLALITLGANPAPGRYDIPHLQEFHRKIFERVYTWAGEFRTVQITKDGHLTAISALGVACPFRRLNICM